MVQDSAESDQDRKQDKSKDAAAAHDAKTSLTLGCSEP